MSRYERIANALDDTAADTPVDDAVDPVELDCSGNGAPLANLNNAVRLLESDPDFRSLVHYDTFLKRIITGNPARDWTDADDISLTVRIQRERGISRMGRDTVAQAVIKVASENTRNCVRNWMDSLVWDKVPRIEHFFEDHFGADATAYIRAASHNLWISMPARIYKPGCKADNMVILEGAQGTRKSTALQTIGGDWFTEQHESISTKDFFQVLQGKLVIEISELEAFSRVEVSKVKQVVSNRIDRYRVPYGRHAQDHPRQCIFVGTTNRDDWHKDETGGRRFWPIACIGNIDVEAIVAAREQLFAEAVHRYKAGEKWWEMPDDETRIEQEKRYDDDSWIEPISDFVKLSDEVFVNDILIGCLKIDMQDVDRSQQMRVAACLRRLGWKKGKNLRVDGQVRKVWKRVSE